MFNVQRSTLSQCLVGSARVSPYAFERRDKLLAVSAGCTAANSELASAPGAYAYAYFHLDTSGRALPGGFSFKFVRMTAVVCHRGWSVCRRVRWMSWPAHVLIQCQSTKRMGALVSMCSVSRESTMSVGRGNIGLCYSIHRGPDIDEHSTTIFTPRHRTLQSENRDRELQRMFELARRV